MSADAPPLILLLRWVIGPSIAAGLVSLGLVLACRTFWRLSRPIGIVVSAGVAIRLLAGFALFWTSYLTLPFATSQQLGRGFWTMALDAYGYYTSGLFAAEQGVATLSAATPSPSYVQALSLWMAVVGTSPFSSVLFNVTCYVAACALIVSVLRGLKAPRFDALTATALLLMTASPMMLFVTTQVLKDAYFVLFAVLLNVGAWWTLRVLSDDGLGSWRQLVPGVLAFTVGVFVTSGVRVYYPAIVIACLAAAALVAFAMPHGAPRMLRLGGSVATILLAAVALGTGSPEGRNYLALMSPAARAVVQRLDTARRGFVASGGATNVVVAVDPASLASIDAPIPGASSGSIAGRLRGLAIGLATMVVPLSVLRAASIVQVTPSASTAIGDIDTVFFDAALLLTAVMMWRSWRGGGASIPYAVFAFLLLLLLSTSMAYTVTNVGTLVRLRLMVLVPVWTAAFVFARLPEYASAGVPYARSERASVLS